MKIPLTIQLFLPVIVPSWRFFGGIGPSPRVEYTLLQHASDVPKTWHEFRPRPPAICFWGKVRRLFLNSTWNETLYINTCAERLFLEYAWMREQEIIRRILDAYHRGNIISDAKAQFLAFRIRMVIREHHSVTQPVVFVSQAASIHAGAI